MTRCRSCQASILWTVTAKGERMPVDAEPVAGGNVRLLAGPGVPLASVVGPTMDLFDVDDDGTRYVAHFVSCPNADEWRRT